MNREILFKAKRLDNGGWIEGYYFAHWGKHFILWGVLNNEEPSKIEIDPDTLCEYIGKIDKSENKIFENDIVSVHQFLFDGREQEYEIKGVIEYNSDCAGFSLKLTEAKDVYRYMAYSEEDDVHLSIPLCEIYGLHEESYTILGNTHD